jgi:hypothetical protein
MTNKYCCFLERDSVQFGRQVTTFLTKVLFNISLSEGAGIELLRKDGKGKGTSIPLQACTGT